jgi:hypothetical protein
MSDSNQVRSPLIYGRVAGAVTTGASLSTSLLSAGIGAGVSLAAAGVSDWLNSIQLSHDADSATTEIANGLATQLQNLSAAYFAEPNVTCADQRAALDAFDQALVWFQSPAGCGNPAYGAAGNACISQRAFPGAKYSYIDDIRTPMANDPRLANAGCDTSADVILPTVSGGYADTGITAAGGSSATGQTAAQIAAAAVAATTTPATSPVVDSALAAATPSSTIFAGIPDSYVYIGAGIAAFLLLRSK